MNEYLVKEKKASNALIEASAIEYAELWSSSQSTIIKSKRLMKDFDKERAKEKLSTQAKERKERIRHSKNMKAAKEKIVQEKKEKNEMIEKIKKLENTQRRLTKDMNNMKKALLEEVTKGKKFSEKVESEKSKLIEEKKKRHQYNKKTHDRLKEKEEKISHLKQNLSTMSDEIKGNVKETRKALKEKKRLEMSLKRKDKILNEVLEKNNELRDVIEDESVTEGKNDSTSVLKVKRESFVGRKGGGHLWPVRVVQLICELLVDGAPPSSIPRIIYTTSSTMTNEEPKDLPSVNFVRGCRIIAQIIGETIAAIKLARSKS